MIRVVSYFFPNEHGSLLTKYFTAVAKRDVVGRSEDGVNLNLRGDGQEYELMIAEVKP